MSAKARAWTRIYEHETVRVPDLWSEARWPEYSTGAADLGAGSVLSFQSYVEGDNLGALNLYSTQRHAFGDESEHISVCSSPPMQPSPTPAASGRLS